ncbi:hypothetical protein Ctaglu_48690 [Clostridium tagluense]|uniref:Transposase IS801/IS1294 domain-containing protein n=2 Tax=Clostridium tagluense TaxID=360422 RepID=A0A401UUS9_9CLOT|nr:hypothetical protein Ctaglu_48690 [Clostridium tagluense]
MTLTLDEFIIRFLMHVLSRKFVKIRHYGILSNRNRSTKLQKCKELTGAVENKNQNLEVKLSAAELLLKLTGIDINICSCCGKGKLITKEKLKLIFLVLKQISERWKRLNPHSSGNAASFFSLFQKLSNFSGYHHLSIYLW